MEKFCIGDLTWIEYALTQSIHEAEQQLKADDLPNCEEWALRHRLEIWRENAERIGRIRQSRAKRVEIKR